MSQRWDGKATFRPAGRKVAAATSNHGSVVGWADIALNAFERGRIRSRCTFGKRPSFGARIPRKRCKGIRDILLLLFSSPPVIVRRYAP